MEINSLRRNLSTITDIVLFFLNRHGRHNDDNSTTSHVKTYQHINTYQHAQQHIAQTQQTHHTPKHIFLISTDTGPLYSKWHEACKGMGHGPHTLALKASHGRSSLDERSLSLFLKELFEREEKEREMIRAQRKRETYERRETHGREERNTRRERDTRLRGRDGERGSDLIVRLVSHRSWAFRTCTRERFSVHRQEETHIHTTHNTHHAHTTIQHVHNSQLIISARSEQFANHMKGQGPRTPALRASVFCTGS